MPKPSVDDHPTVGEQIEALFGVRDTLMLLARDAYEQPLPNNYFLLQFLAHSVDMATSALHLTFSESKPPAVDLYEAPVFEPRGFQRPWEWRCKAGGEAAEPTPSTTVNN